jgi:hypothetical protein
LSGYLPAPLFQNRTLNLELHINYSNCIEPPLCVNKHFLNDFNTAVETATEKGGDPVILINSAHTNDDYRM